MAFFILLNMGLLKPYIDRLEHLSKNLESIAEKALAENAPEIVSLLKYEQLSKGLTSKNLPISNGTSHTGKYRPDTKIFAERDGVAIPKITGAPYNFSWSGQTLDLMYLKITPSKQYFEILTKDGKMNFLRDFYNANGDIFKLTEKHNDYVNNKFIIPALYKEMFQVI